MPYDPQWPQNGQNIDADRFRGQFGGLVELINSSAGGLTAVEVDAVNTLPPGQAAAVSATLVGSTLHFTFDIPQGDAGAAGSDGAPGATGADGAPGAPGEVTLAQLDSAIDTTSANSNGVATLGITVSDPPTQSEVQDIVNKLDELITALRR